MDNNNTFKPYFPKEKIEPYENNNGYDRQLSVINSELSSLENYDNSFNQIPFSSFDSNKYKNNHFYNTNIMDDDSSSLNLSIHMQTTKASSEEIENNFSFNKSPNLNRKANAYINNTNDNITALMNNQFNAINNSILDTSNNINSKSILMRKNMALKPTISLPHSSVIPNKKQFNDDFYSLNQNINNEKSGNLKFFELNSIFLV